MADESNHDDDTADDDKLMRTVDLIHQRAQGKVSNAQLERAVAELLHQPVILDTENYDDDDSGDDVQKEPPTNDSKVAASAHRVQVPPTRTTRSQKAEGTGPSQPQTTTTTRTTTGVQQDDSATSINWEIYQDIPLGRQGAQMMTTFGDGKIPHPTVVRKTLQGARRMLITAIQDARHYRHQQSVKYRATKKTIQKFQIAHTDPEIVFRAEQGYDHYARIPKCGFSEDDLRVLYPGTMNEFERWNNMQAEADAKDAAKPGQVDDTMALEDEPDDDNNDDQNQQDKDDTPPQPAPGLCGHLRDRAENFDLRTDKMNAPWYLKYSVLRQGSFLPPKRRGRTTNATNDTVWEQSSRTNKATGWQSMTASAVRFLHWVGFDPESALPPPNEATTSALAFLCYDFFGRIVEKAIYLRLQQQTADVKKTKRVDHDDDDTLELPPGQQLHEVDIDAAMECPDIQPVSLYSASSSESKQQQLYFGPGFEDRLELELEEMVGGGGKHQLSAEELERRRAEDALFSKLAETPVTEDGVAVLVSKLKKSPAKKKRQKRKRVSRKNKTAANEYSDEGSDGDYVEGE